MSLSALQNPLSALNNLSTIMSWRGVYNPTTPYFQNDIVVSPITSASYLLTATSAFGQDPSLNPSWGTFGTNGAGVQVVKGSTYIDVSGNGTNPTITNKGIVTIDLIEPLYNTGDTQNYIINSDAIATIQGIVGIQVVGNQINNLGILSGISGGNGMSATFDPTTQNVHISNDGVIELESNEPYIIITGPQSALNIANGGILNITAAGDLTNIGTATDPKIQNDGVITLTSPTNTVLNIGTDSFQELRAACPEFTKCFDSVIFNAIQSDTKLFNFTYYDVEITPQSLLASCLADGIPYSTGVFFIDMSFLLIVLGQAWWIAPFSENLYVTFLDETSTPPNTYALPFFGKKLAGGVVPTLPGCGMSPYRIPFDLATALSNGMRTITALTFNTPFGAQGAKSPVSNASCYGYYYPNGIE